MPAEYHDGRRIPTDPEYVSSLDVRFLRADALADDIRQLQLGVTLGQRRRYYQAGRAITETNAAALVADRLNETAGDLIDYLDVLAADFASLSRGHEAEIREWAHLLRETADSIYRYASVRHALLDQLAPVMLAPTDSPAIDAFRDSLTDPGFISSSALAASALEWQRRTGQSLGLTATADGTPARAGTLRLFAALDLPQARRRIDGRVVRGYLIP
jgi:hypothetical protein